MLPTNLQALENKHAYAVDITCNIFIYTLPVTKCM
jgi:hypothetical protein